MVQTDWPKDTGNIDAQYYGRAPEKKPKSLLYAHVLDQHIKKILEKNHELFRMELIDDLANLKKNGLSEIKQIKKELTQLKQKIKTLQDGKQTRRKKTVPVESSVQISNVL